MLLDYTQCMVLRFHCCGLHIQRERVVVWRMDCMSRHDLRGIG